MARFAELKHRRADRKTSPEKSSRPKQKQPDGGSRELKCLECPVNYERTQKKSNVREGSSSDL